MDSATRVQILKEAVYIQCSANNFGKGIILTIPALGK